MLEAAVVAMVFAASWVLLRLLAAALAAISNRISPDVVYLALVAPAVGWALAALVSYDPNVAMQDLYRPEYLALAGVAVLVQWVLVFSLALLPEKWAADPAAISRWIPVVASRLAAGVWRFRYLAVLAVLVGCGLALRLEHMTTEPFHHDEVGAYRFTMGIWDRGVPSAVIHPDMPLGICATSELVYYPKAITSLFFDEPLYVLRVTTVCWATATILLIYFVGRRLFSPQVGIVAAALYTFAPYCIGMSNFGRYFSQLQFMALLTCYCFYQTIRGSGPINRRALWCTAAAFSATFLSWEGSGFLAPGLALAALVHRRRNLKSIFGEPSIWAALLTVGTVFLARMATAPSSRRNACGTVPASAIWI